MHFMYVTPAQAPSIVAKLDGHDFGDLMLDSII